MDQALSRDNKPLFIGDFQRHIGECRNIVGHILASFAIPTGRCLNQLAVFITELDGQAVQLQHEQRRSHGKHGNQIIGLFGLVQA